MRFLFLTLTYLVAATMWSSTSSANAYDNEWENVQSNKNQYNNANDEEVEAKIRKVDRDQSEEAEDKRIASSTRVRRFHEVLDELLAEFAYDVRMGQLKALKNVSIRKVDVSDSLPKTYRQYVELLIAERIKENSRVKIISCIPCKTKTSRLVEGKLMITSPTTNVGRMQQAADQLGVDNFIDVVLVYHTTHMVLAMQIFNTGTQELTWARTYNSETIKSRYQKLAIDYKQVEKSRPGEDYVPDYRFLFGLGGGIIPNVNNKSEDNGMVTAMIRGMEKFDNRRHEFGLQLSLYMKKNSILGDHGTSSEGLSIPKKMNASAASELSPWSSAFAIYGMYARHLVGSIESYNDVRHGLNIGLGFLMAPSYLTASVRAGWDIFFGRRFTTNLSIIGIAPSTVYVSNESVATSAGVGVELGMSINY